MSTYCKCGHEKRDHVLPLMGKQGYGNCKVCLCDRYNKDQPHEFGATAKLSSQA